MAAKDRLTNKIKECFNTGMDTNALIDKLGGTNAVAKICEVTAQAVSQWRNDGIPSARLMYLRLLRPDVFAAVDAESATNPEARAA